MKCYITSINNYCIHRKKNIDEAPEIRTMSSKTSQNEQFMKASTIAHTCKLNQLYIAICTPLFRSTIRTIIAALATNLSNIPERKKEKQKLTCIIYTVRSFTVYHTLLLDCLAENIVQPLLCVIYAAPPQPRQHASDWPPNTKKLSGSFGDSPQHSSQTFIHQLEMFNDDGLAGSYHNDVLHAEVT